MRDENTASSPIYLETARHLAERLAGAPGPAARALHAEAVALAEIFGRWETQRPTPDEKVSAIQRVFDLQRRAMELDP